MLLSTMIDKSADEFLETNIKGMMMTLIALWNARMDSERAESEFSDIRPSDMRLFGNLRGRSMRLSKIHLEMGYSRQAAQQAVARLVSLGMLKVEPITGSKRDKLVTITAKGQRRRTLAARQIKELEADCADSIGAEGIETLRTLLIQLVTETKRATKSED